MLDFERRQIIAVRIRREEHRDKDDARCWRTGGTILAASFGIIAFL